MSERHDIPLLIAQTGPAAGQRWLLTRPSLTIGRDAECDIIIPDRQVSRVHARLVRDSEGYRLEDLESKNGTHVNGQAIRAPCLLRDGDLIQVALAAKLVFVASEATMPLAAASARAVRMAGTPAEPTSASGRLRLDSAGRRIWVGDHELDPPLSVPQFRFLELLYRNLGQVCSREQVVAVVWPEAQSAGVSEQAIDALVRRLRDRLAELDPEHTYISTVRGHGFRLDNPPADE